MSYKSQPSAKSSPGLLDDRTLLLEVDEQEKMSFPGLIGSSTGPVLTGSSTGPILIGSDRIVVASETNKISGLSSKQIEKIFDIPYSNIKNYR